MKKMYSKPKLLFSLLFFSFLFFNASHAQQDRSVAIDEEKHNHLENDYAKTSGNLTISFTEKIPFDDSSLRDLESASWIISNSNGLVKKGRGVELANYVFNTPGNYIINFSISQAFTKVKNSCYHPSLPSKMLLEVKPYKLTFNFDTFKLSKEIMSGTDAKDIQLSIQATLESFNDTPFLYNHDVTTAGIQTTVMGKLNKEMQLFPGNNTLTFQLQGTVQHPNTYIMFDFIDVNGDIKSYSLTKPIR